MLEQWARVRAGRYRGGTTGNCAYRRPKEQIHWRGKLTVSPPRWQALVSARKCLGAPNSYVFDVKPQTEGMDDHTGVPKLPLHRDPPVATTCDYDEATKECRVFLFFTAYPLGVTYFICGSSVDGRPFVAGVRATPSLQLAPVGKRACVDDHCYNNILFFI